MKPDFRTPAAEATFNRLGDRSGPALADLGESGCVLIPGGRRLHCLIELPSFAFSLVCMLGVLLAYPLTWMGVVPRMWTFPILLIGLVLSLVHRKIKSWILSACLASRSDGFLKHFRELPSRSMELEDGQTHKKLKLLNEDAGVCLLDPDHRRLLLEGSSYRYAIYAKDVYSIEPISNYALSGARLISRMAGHPFDVVLKTAGEGPLASLTQSFAPSVGAKGLAHALVQTLFDTDAPTYRQAALPPPLVPGTGQ